MNKSTDDENSKELSTYRRLLALTSLVYLFWWFAVDALLPTAFNPFLGRFAVIAIVFAVFVMSYFDERVRQRIRFLAIASTWLLTAHYFYLFYGNSGDFNWVVGAFITVIAINLGQLSAAELLSYTAFVTALSSLMVLVIPGLEHSVFLPGIITIFIQANIALRSRLEMIKTLENTNRRFQLLFNSTFEGVLVHENGIIIDINDSLVHMLGFSRQELIGKNVIDLLHPDQRERIAEGMKSDILIPYETKGMTRAGATIDIEVRAKSFKDGKRLARLVTIQDTSDRKRAESEKIIALTMKENVRIRDEFISIASHELRTPISTLKLQTRMIERELKKTDDRVLPPEYMENFISLFHRQIDRLTELVETMLDVSRISSGRLKLTFQSVDFTAVVREIASSLQLQSEYSKQLLSIDAAEQIIIWADRSRIEQIVENILTNALKYGDGKPVFCKVIKADSEVFFIVEDHGIGIAEEYLQRIFERFERAISARHISGLGLGLYITRQIVEAHSGSIHVQSKLGEGSTFTVRLPLKATDRII